MNLTLYKREWKENWILVVIFAAVLTVYASMIIAMFDPKLGDSLRTMAESMPEIFAAVGMADVGETLIEFISGYLYGILLTAFPAVYIIILSNRLVVRYVDSGSMAYIIAVPEKRSKIVRTQAIFSISSLFVLLVYVVGLIIACSQLMFPGKLDVAKFLYLNLGLFGFWMMVGGICFFFSCLFNETKMTSGCSTAFVVYSLLVQMLSQVGAKFEGLKYITPMTLFQVRDMAAGKSGAMGGCVVMYGVGISFYVAGVQAFKRKDLPL